MKTIILDTNALMAIAEWKIDLFSEIEKCCSELFCISVLEGTLRELEKIGQEQRGRYKLAAKLALSLVRLKKIKIILNETIQKDIQSKGKKSVSGDNPSVDDLLVEHSQQGDWVLTQDAALKKRLQKPYLTIRQKKKVVMIG